MSFLTVRVFDRTVAITQEQARWLAAELRSLHRLDVTGAGGAAAARIERALTDGAREADEETTDEGVRSVLMALEDLAEGPEPVSRLQELHDILTTELVRRAEEI
jgi:hypothetical protein